MLRRFFKKILVPLLFYSSYFSCLRIIMKRLKKIKVSPKVFYLNFGAHFKIGCAKATPISDE